MIINNYNPVINFQSNKRYYKAGPYNETIGTQTVVNREDLDFKNTAKIILKLYKDAPKINIYSVACSDGSEAYTLAMQLLESESYKGEANKCFPITATDIDPTILRCANSKRLNMTNEDINRLKNDGIDYRKYFTPAEKKMYIMNDHLDEETKTFLAKNNIKDHIKFERKTILQQANEITRDIPNVFCCRNVLPYVGDDAEQIRHLQKIGRKLGNNDLLIIGDFDRSLRNIKELKLLGFKEIARNVFKKH